MVVYCVWLGSSKFSLCKLICCCLSDLGQLNTNVFILLSSTYKAWKPSPFLSQPLLHSSQSAWSGQEARRGHNSESRPHPNSHIFHVTSYPVTKLVAFFQSNNFFCPLPTVFILNHTVSPLTSFCPSYFLILHCGGVNKSIPNVNIKYFCIKQYNQDPLYYFSKINIQQERKAISLYLSSARRYSRLVTLTKSS